VYDLVGITFLSGFEVCPPGTLTSHRLAVKDLLPYFTSFKLIFEKSFMKAIYLVLTPCYVFILTSVLNEFFKSD
jgi:hypothetical protein